MQHLRILCIGIWRLPPESTSIGMRKNNILGRLSTIDLKYIYIYGLRDCIFYSTNRRSPGIRCQVESKDKNGSMPEIIEEPSFWQIAIRKDTTFSKYRTYIVNAFEDISAIQNIANKYYKSSGVPKDEVFDYIYVEQLAKPKIGIEEIRTIIQNNFHMSYAHSDQRIPIFVELIVYSDGTARVKGLAKRTGNATVDNEALRVADIISKTGFIPAMHRGEYVNSLYAIPSQGGYWSFTRKIDPLYLDHEYRLTHMHQKVCDMTI